MKDTLLVQQSSGPHVHLLNLTIRDHSNYCARHGFDYWPIYGGALTKADGDRHAFWDKLKLILRGVEAGYERVIWLDSDCYIADPDVDLRDACPVDGLGMVWHGKDRWHEHAECYDHWNCGAVYCSAGPEAKRLLKCWWQAKDDGHFWHDQHALNKNAIPAYEALFRKTAPVHKIGLEWNAVPFAPFNHDKPIVAAWHGYHSDIEKRLAVMQEFVRSNTMRRMLEGCTLEEAQQKAEFCMSVGNLDGALVFFGRAEELGAEGPGFESEYARCCYRKQMYAESAEHYRKVLEFDPENGMIWQALSSCYDFLGEHEKNGEAIRAAKQFSPNWPPLMHNEMLWQLRDGDWRNGFEGMKWQFLIRERISRVPGPEWDGKGGHGTLLVWAEQGLGDTLMLARFIPKPRYSSMKILLEVQAPLATLMQAQCWPGVEVVARPDEGGGVPWTFDAHVGMFTLPAIAGATPENTVGTPYLKAPAEHIAKWLFRINPPVPAAEIEKMGAMRVGFSWAGSSGHGNNRNRNMQAGHFDALSQTPGTRWYSLQRDIVISEEMKAENPHIAWIGDDFEDMADTAGALMNLDLVITIDSAIAHLCGALGLKVWCLISKSSDWRWLLNRTDTPWYQSMTLYRQEKLGDWDSVVERVERDLKELLSNGN